MFWGLKYGCKYDVMMRYPPSWTCAAVPATGVRLPAAVVAQRLRRASSVRLSPFRNRFVAAVDLSSGLRVLN